MSNSSNPTQQTCVVPIGVQGGVSDGSLQWFLEHGKDSHAPVFYKNNLNVYICGEDAFERIASDIRHAKKSIDIVCWGFDPAMELTRTTRNHWPRGESWGSLLLDAATGRWTNGQPVQVRVLSWYGFIGSSLQNNMPGYAQAGTGGLAPSWRAALTALLRGEKANWTIVDELTIEEKRQKANDLWFDLARSRDIPSLNLRIRNGDDDAIQNNLSKIGGQLGVTEHLLIEHFGTFHQKTILIDYDDESANAQPVGYVMGLNSVTDYWDTQAHYFHDPKRGRGWEGTDGDQNTDNLKPLQDYACRIEGEALVMVSKNFTDGWNQAQRHGNGQNIKRTHDVKKPPPHLTLQLTTPRQNAQIVRTLPDREGGETTIQRLYFQTLKSARRYIYVENQYFQYAPWLKKLKEERQAYITGHKKGGTDMADVPALHLIVVTCTPEKAGMVPRTHDAVTEIGYGSSAPNQSKRAEDDMKRFQAEQARFDAYQKSHAANKPSYGSTPTPPPRPTAISDITKTYYASGGGKRDSVIAKQLKDELGLRCLVASLWTFDANWAETERAKRNAAEGLWTKLRETVRKKPAPVSIADRYREIYIHSKLMIADDSMFTLGSANMNLRSFAGDGEINVVTDDPAKSKDLRQRVWGMHTHGASTSCTQEEFQLAGGHGSQKEMEDTFEKWLTLMQANKKAKDEGFAITGFLVPFHDDRTSSVRLG